jgi:cytidylate kinase
LGDVIAIDGPAGAGKSTVAMLLARELGFRYLDTGSMYRAITYLSMKRNIDPDDDGKLIGLCKMAQFKFNFDPVRFLFKIFVNGEDVTQLIRTKDVDFMVSAVSKNPGVRSEMVKKQRLLIGNDDAVVEGRDIASVVFRRAILKIFLNASPQERAKRRIEQNRKLGMGNTDSLEQVISQIKMRDELDSSRKQSPLVPTRESIIIDSTARMPEGIVSEIIDEYRRRKSSL